MPIEQKNPQVKKDTHKDYPFLEGGHRNICHHVHLDVCRSSKETAAINRERAIEEVGMCSELILLLLPSSIDRTVYKLENILQQARNDSLETFMNISSVLPLKSI